MPFPYKTVLITGATSGIGRALTERMIDANVFVIAVGRQKDRLDELVAKYGSNKVAGEAFNISDLNALGGWSKKITTTYPKLDAIFLNAGFQQTVDFTNPSSIALHSIDNEVTTNYLSTIHIITHFLPHLISRNPEPAGIIMVSSGLSIIPMPQVANYCATKAAVHSLAWSLRAQLAGPQMQEKKTGHIRVVEVVPPAVKTELHTRQGREQMGLDLDDYVDETWAQLTAEEDIFECLPGVLREQGLGKLEEGKRRVFEERLKVYQNMK
ncbi:NAD(P)-binding protein [Hypoxylon crocopeplum]|nr:NAD(P)-binding protein [Hypoxylon crocopeplum]